MGSPLHSLCLFYRPCYKGVGVINNICYNIFKITSRSVVRCFRQKFSGEQVHLRTPSERCEVGMCSLALPPSRTQSNLLSSLSHPRSETQALLLFSLEYHKTFWEACDVCLSSDRWEGTCGNRFRTKILVSPKGRTVHPPQTQRRTHSFKGVLIPALSQAGLNWRLWFPGFLCLWL